MQMMKSKNVMVVKMKSKIDKFVKEIDEIGKAKEKVIMTV